MLEPIYMGNNTNEKEGEGKRVKGEGDDLRISI